MPWSLYIRDSDGQLLSVADTDDPPPAGVVRMAVTSDPRDPALMYDPAQRAMVARPAKVLIDRWQDLRADPTFAAIYSSLNATRKAQIQAVLVRVFGKFRYRSASEPLELG